MRVIVVGINPAKGSPKIKGTLARLAGWMDKIGIKHWSFINCVPEPGPYSLKQVDYDHVSSCTNGYDKIIALGGFPSSALSRLGINHHVLPHPSGLNRNLNDKVYEEDQVNRCKDYIYG